MSEPLECEECGAEIKENDPRIACEDCCKLCCGGCSYGDYCVEHKEEGEEEEDDDS